ncbi:MAG: UDP-N-acetylmuramate dehydrogenase [Lachnospiraceae bacterium]|nr:UDP-N-acetylmuramate dehydrogenase [Lachnospiraceae bacterium]
MTELTREISKIIPEERLLTDEPMRLHTTFRVGGRAAWFARVCSEAELSQLLSLLKGRTPYYIVGNGSNLLVSDKGYDGVIINLTGGFEEIGIEGTVISAGSGALLVKTSNEAQHSALTGLEFAAGIPGSIGGAVVMNAGAYGGEIAQVIKSVRAMEPDGNILTLQKEDLMLGYRTSIFKTRELVCLQAVFELERGDALAIRRTMDELNEKRRQKQPVEFPSAGSTFKRPEGYFAGKLIMDAGLCGYRVGGAMVSEKHCGFVINAGEATASDVKTLMDEITQRVMEKFSVRLEPEVCMIGDF